MTAHEDTIANASLSLLECANEVLKTYICVFHCSFTKLRVSRQNKSQCRRVNHNAKQNLSNILLTTSPPCPHQCLLWEVFFCDCYILPTFTVNGLQTSQIGDRRSQEKAQNAFCCTARTRLLDPECVSSQFCCTANSKSSTCWTPTTSRWSVSTFRSDWPVQKEVRLSSVLVFNWNNDRKKPWPETRLDPETFETADLKPKLTSSKRTNWRTFRTLQHWPGTFLWPGCRWRRAETWGDLTPSLNSCRTTWIKHRVNKEKASNCDGLCKLHKKIYVVVLLDKTGLKKYTSLLNIQMHNLAVTGSWAKTRGRTGHRSWPWNLRVVENTCWIWKLTSQIRPRQSWVQ